MATPRAVFEFDGKMDYEDKYKEKVLEYRTSAREQAYRTLRNSPEFNYVHKYISYLEGNQWARMRPVHKSKFVHNRLEQARKERLALLTDSKPIIEVSTTIDEFKEEAGIIKNILKSEWLSSNLDVSLMNVADIAMLWGTGFWKIGASNGRISVIPCGPDNVMPIQPGMDLQDSQGILYRTWKPINYFRDNFPWEFANLDKTKSGFLMGQSGGTIDSSSLQETTWNSFSPGFQRILGNTTSLRNELPINHFGSLELEEYWIEDKSINESNKTITIRHPYLSTDQHNYWYRVKPGERLYPRKRLIVFAGDHVLYDGPSPHWSGLYPFACLRFDPHPWSFYGYSLYRNLIPMQEAINDIGAGMIDIIKKVLNPTLMSKQGSVSDAAWRMFQADKPGAKLLLNPLAQVSDVRYGDNPDIPAYVPQMLLSYYNPEFDKMSGLMDISTLSGKKQVPGGDTLEQMRDSLQTSLRRDMRLMEAFIRDAGRVAVSHIIQYYNTKKRLQLLGEDGITLHDFDYNGENLIPANARKEEFWKNFGFTIVPGSLHGGAKDRSRIENVTLAMQGLISRKELLRRLDVDPGDIDRIMSELAEESQAIGPTMGRAPRSAERKNG